LLIGVTDESDMHLLGNELGDSPIEVGVNAVLIVETWIDEIIREADYC
jgi:hypothetical protein